MNRLLLIIICFLLPPVAIFIQNGVGKDLLINIVLTVFFFVPGVIHAIWLVTK